MLIPYFRCHSLVSRAGESSVTSIKNDSKPDGRERSEGKFVTSKIVKVNE